MAQLDSGADWL